MEKSDNNIKELIVKNEKKLILICNEKCSLKTKANNNKKISNYDENDNHVYTNNHQNKNENHDKNGFFIVLASVLVLIISILI